MTLRKTIKRWLYGSCPGFSGRFPYFGVDVYFPKGSQIFYAACAQGVFEIANVRILQALARPDTVSFDVGANIGLMAVPVLTHVPECRVVSFEPSPNVLPSLRRTIDESSLRNRWTLVPKAVGAKSGRVIFNLSAVTDSMFDGIQPTNRVATVRQEEVELTTLDETWHSLGRPKVSHIKIDVEGGEMDVLAGARECLATERPPVLLEWNRQNFQSYQRRFQDLLDFAVASEFQLLAIPHLVEIKNDRQLDLHMAMTENFLLLPEGQNA